MEIIVIFSSRYLRDSRSERISKDYTQTADGKTHSHDNDLPNMQCDGRCDGDEESRRSARCRFGQKVETKWKRVEQTIIVTMNKNIFIKFGGAASITALRFVEDNVTHAKHYKLITDNNKQHDFIFIFSLSFVQKTKELNH